MALQPTVSAATRVQAVPRFLPFYSREFGSGARDGVLFLDPSCIIVAALPNLDTSVSRVARVNNLASVV